MLATLGAGLPFFSGCGTKETPETNQESMTCSQLNPGDSKLVRSIQTGILARYKLQREQSTDGSTSYLITLNIKFINRDSSDDPGFPQEMEATARQCFAEMDPYLSGPNGEHLKIRLTRPDDALPLPPQVTVRITGGQERAHVLLWNKSFDCGQILHESLHLLGLVDEYKEVLLKNPKIKDEEEAKSKPPYDCRALGPANSIMSDPIRAEFSVSDAYQLFECYCDSSSDSPKTQECRQSLLSIRGNPGNCPEPTLKKQINATSALYFHFDTRSSLSEREDRKKEWDTYISGKLIDSDHYRYTTVTPALQKSILLPAHFNSIAYPNCADVNAVFYKCASHAYLTSKDHAGNGCKEELPAECADGKTDWLLK